MIAKKRKELLDRWCISFLFRKAFWHKDNEQMGIVQSHLVIKFSELVEIYYRLHAVLGFKKK